MHKSKLVLIFLLLLFSCSETEETNESIESNPNNNTALIHLNPSNSHLNRIEFLYRIKNKLDNTNTVSAIDFYLKNNNSFPVCYLTETCFGESNSLEFDHDVLKINEVINCNTSYPEIVTINPNDSVSFSANFQINKPGLPFQFGFNFYTINCNANLNISNNEYLSKSSENKTIIKGTEIK